MRIASRIALGAASGIFILFGQSWAAILPLAVLYGVLLMPGRRAVEVWPYGLVALLAVAYLTYIILWMFGVNGINHSSSRGILFVVAAVGVWSPSTDQRSNRIREEFQPTVVLSVMFAGATILYLLAFRRPDVLINVHLGGGDHSNHVGFSYQLISHLHRAPMPSPFTLTGYQHAVHFLVALFSASSILSFRGTSLGLVFRDFAVFDILAMAGVIQIAASSAIRTVKNRTVVNFLAIVPALILSRIPNLLGHFWLSGFSTSLVALLVLAALVGAQFTSHYRSDRVIICIISSLVLLGVYQPLAVAPLAALFLEIWNPRLQRHIPRIGVTSLFLFLPMVGILSVGVLEGRGGEIGITLLRDGVSLQPSLKIYFGILIGLIVLGITTRKSLSPILTSLAIFSIANGFWMLSRQLGADGTPVYYVRKLIWTAIAVGALVILVTTVAGFRSWVSSITSSLGSSSTVALILASSFLIGVNPVTRFTFVNGHWFVAQLLDQKNSITSSSIALNPADVFTSHLANVALTAASPLAHEFDLVLLQGRSSQDLCTFSYELGATEVFTASSQADNLITLGCGKNGQRIVAGGD